MSAGNEWANDDEDGGCWPFVKAGVGWLIVVAAVAMGSIGWAGRVGGRAGGGRRA